MSITEISAIIGAAAVGWIIGSLIGSFIYDKIELRKLRKELERLRFKNEIMDIIFK